MELRGYANTVAGNQIVISAGYGLKIAADAAPEDLGRDNITANTFRGQPAGALDDTSTAPSGLICGNVIGSGSTAGDFPAHPGWSTACRGNAVRAWGAR